jgi:hypothetical protein
MSCSELCGQVGRSLPDAIGYSRCGGGFVADQSARQIVQLCSAYNKALPGIRSASSSYKFIIVRIMTSQLDISRTRTFVQP